MMLVTASMASPSYAGTVSFGSGINLFNMDFEIVGDPGNAADTTGVPNPAGGVNYIFGIGKYEVSRDMVNKYNNTAGTVKITLDSMTGLTGGTEPNKPATGISWNEAARFVNWLNTSTGGYAAYKFETSGGNDNSVLWALTDTYDYDPSNPYRSKRATYVLPNYNEWYKAAYYDPTKTTGTDKYWDYATRSDTAPTSVASGTGDGTAVYDRSVPSGPANVNQAGGLSYYDVMGMGGNVYEVEESSFDLLNSSGTSLRALRGGHWNGGSTRLLSSTRFSVGPGVEDRDNGFRVVMVSPVPEPSGMLIATFLYIGAFIGNRQRKK
jgi:hypothetical protein